MTLKQMAQSNGHDCMDILKIDVDGAEGNALRETDWTQMCIGMLLIELHSNHIVRITGRPFRVTDAMTAIQRLEKAGFMMYASEMVCHGCGGNGQAELAFVNTSWVREVLSLGA